MPGLQAKKFFALTRANQNGSLIIFITFLFMIALILVIAIVDLGDIYLAKKQLIQINESALSSAIQSIDQKKYYSIGINQLTGRIPIDCAQAGWKLLKVTSISNLRNYPVSIDSWSCNGDAIYLTTHSFIHPIIPLGFFSNWFESNSTIKSPPGMYLISANAGETSQIQS